MPSTIFSLQRSNSAMTKRLSSTCRRSAITMAINPGSDRCWLPQHAKIPTLAANSIFDPRRVESDISIIIGFAESELEPQQYRAEPVLGEMKCSGGPEFCNRLVDVALLMNSVSALIGVAGFKRDKSRADGADDCDAFRGGACHSMSSLRT